MIRFDFSGDEGTPLRILCLGAHPDDIEIGCGGTLLRLLHMDGLDLEVFWIVFSGNGTRSAEARTSAEKYLANVARSEVVVEGFSDSFFPQEQKEIKNFFESRLKPLDPDLIFTHYRDDRHQDHRVISDLAWNTFRNHLILEYEIIKYDGDLGVPNAFFALSEETSRRKIDLLMEAFPSQTQKAWFTPETFRSILRLRGVEAGVAPGGAEAFYARKIRF